MSDDGDADLGVEDRGASGRADVEDRGADPFAALDPEDAPDVDPFEEIDVGSVDEEVVWADLAEEDADGNGSPVGVPPPDVDVACDGAVVPKHSYCERCEYFADPPEVSCASPGTEIRELMDVDHFRVVNCPVVARRLHVGGPTED